MNRVERSMPEKKKILVVEDEFFLADIIRARLEFLGYEVSLAENGEEGLKILREERFDLIIMDAMMPVMDGYEATRQIRADARLKSIPICFLSARALPQDRERANEVGANDYLIKPFEIDRLVAMVKKWT